MPGRRWGVSAVVMMVVATAIGDGEEGRAFVTDDRQDPPRLRYRGGSLDFGWQQPGDQACGAWHRQQHCSDQNRVAGGSAVSHATGSGKFGR